MDEETLKAEGKTCWAASTSRGLPLALSVGDEYACPIPSFPNWRKKKSLPLD